MPCDCSGQRNPDTLHSSRGMIGTGAPSASVAHPVLGTTPRFDTACHLTSPPCLCLARDHPGALVASAVDGRRVATCFEDDIAARAPRDATSSTVAGLMSMYSILSSRRRSHQDTACSVTHSRTSRRDTGGMNQTRPKSDVFIIYQIPVSHKPLTKPPPVDGYSPQARPDIRVSS